MFRHNIESAVFRSGWHPYRLKFTVEQVVGGDWGSEPRGDTTDTLCVRVSDFDYSRGRLKANPSTLRSIDPDKRAARLLRKDDLLLEKSGGGEDQPVGRVVRVADDFGRPTISSNFIARMRPRPGFDPEYLRYIHSALYSQGLTRSSIRQTTGIQNLDVQRYLSTRVVVPSLGEQRRIARFLDADADRLGKITRGKQTLLSLLAEKRRSLYAAAASGELTSHCYREPRPTLPWLSLIPNHWSVAKLSLVAKLGTGHTPSRSDPEYWGVDRTIPWITTGDIERFRDDRVELLTETKERISRFGLENSAAVLHPQGTVALSRTASVGFSVVMGVDMATSQDFVTWTCSPLLEPRFLLICLRAMRRDLVGRLAMGSTHKTIYMADVESLRIPLPPVREQRAIVALVERETTALDEVADLVHRQLPLLAERRDALIAAAVTGQIDPSSYRAPAVRA